MAKHSQWLFPTAKGVSSFPGESKDCTVRALANALELPYDEVHAEMKAAGRKNNEGAYNHQFTPVYMKHGFKPVCVFGTTNGAMWSLKYLKQNGIETIHKAGITIGRLLPYLAEGRYIVEVKGHVFAVVDGEVIDGVCCKTGASVECIWKYEN